MKPSSFEADAGRRAATWCSGQTERRDRMPERGTGRGPSEGDGPGDEDEAALARLTELVSGVTLRATPVAGSACSGCEYYLEEGAGFSYCWHPGLRILVSKDWWCQWFEERA
jgi:hypothetical protein